MENLSTTEKVNTRRLPAPSISELVFLHAARIRILADGRFQHLGKLDYGVSYFIKAI